MRIDLGRVGGARKRRPQPRRDDVRGQCRERMGDRFWVAGRPEDAVDATRGDRGEEVLEVQPDDDEPSGVLACVAAYRSAAREAVRCVVCGDPVEDRRAAPAGGSPSACASAARSPAPADPAGAATCTGSAAAAPPRPCARARVRPRTTQALRRSRQGSWPGRRQTRSRAPASAAAPSPAQAATIDGPRGGPGRRRLAGSCIATAMNLASSRGASAGGRWYAASTSRATCRTHRGRDPEHGRPGRPAHARSTPRPGTRPPSNGTDRRVRARRTPPNHRDVARRLHSVVRALTCFQPDAVEGSRCAGTGHKGVPGVAPERDQRPKARLPTSVTQRRGA